MASMEDLKKLLRGKSDSERMVGLLLVTKLCDKNDHKAILDVYNAINPNFLLRVLLTGIRRDDKRGGGGVECNRAAYLELAISVLAALSRVPEIAAGDEMLSKVPTVLEAISKETIPAIAGDCFEFLFLVSNAHKDGVAMLYESGLIRAVCVQMPALKIGSHEMELAIKLVLLVISKLGEGGFSDHVPELSEMLPIMAKQFALLQNEAKFDALHLLSAILSSNFVGALHEVLRSRMSRDWLTSARFGVMDILQNRVAPNQKLEALIIAESIISMFGEEWMADRTTLLESPSSFPADRCILLVLESSRVEIAVVLNELAYLTYEASSPSNSESFLVKLRNLGVVFSLVEGIIKFISKAGGDQDSMLTDIISESTFTKIISGLDETISVVLDYLIDGKVHGRRKGDDLLACVRIAGSYLAEAPHACKEKVQEVLGYLLTVEGQDEFSNPSCISFLLPLMCQMTMDNDGCKTFLRLALLKQYLIKLLDSRDSEVNDSSSIFLACDTILNVLLKRKNDHFLSHESYYVKLLEVLPRWAENAQEPSVMMASSICSLILKMTSENALLHQYNFKIHDLMLLSLLLKRSLITYCQEDPVSCDPNSVADLYDIVHSGYSCWAELFPCIKQVVEGKSHEFYSSYERS